MIRVQRQRWFGHLMRRDDEDRVWEFKGFNSPADLGAGHADRYDRLQDRWDASSGQELEDSDSSTRPCQ